MRSKRAVTIIFFWILLTAGAVYARHRLTPVGLREGDIIFQTSLSAQSQAIQQATHSPYSHMGILLKTPKGLAVFEAASTVRFTRFDRWVRRGRHWKYVVKRLKNADAVLTKEALLKVHQSAEGLAGKPYDAAFEWSDDKVYCSELAWKIYQRALGIKIGALAALKDFDLSSPVVKAKLEERYHGKIPTNEKVISPQAMFESDLLETVKLE
jgi:hypothetical protein